MERYYDSCTDIPLEHAEVCARDIAECDVDENTRKALSILTKRSQRNHGILMVHG